MENLEIKIKYHSDIEPIKKISQGDWIDLRSAENITMMLGEYKMISLGVSMKLPEGYEAHVAPRSSTFKNFGVLLVNGIGIIDNSYCGDNDIWMFPAICLKNEGATIRKGDRIAQFRIVKKQPEFKITEVDYLTGSNRGGIGSTGIK